MHNESAYQTAIQNGNLPNFHSPLPGMGQNSLHAAHHGAQHRGKNMRLPKHIKSTQGQGQQYQMSPIDAVNIIQKFRNELEREGNLMSEIERKFSIANDPERAGGQLGQFEFGDAANQTQLRLMAAQARVANAPSAAWKTRFNSMSRTTVCQADLQGQFLNGQSSLQTVPQRTRFREMLAQNRFSVVDRTGGNQTVIQQDYFDPFGNENETQARQDNPHSNGDSVKKTRRNLQHVANAKHKNSTFDTNKTSDAEQKHESASKSRNMKSDASKLRNQSNQRNRMPMNAEQRRNQQYGINEEDAARRVHPVDRPEMRTSFSRKRQRQNSEALRESSNQSFNQKLKALSLNHSPEAAQKNRKGQKAANCSKSQTHDRSVAKNEKMFQQDGRYSEHNSINGKQGTKQPFLSSQCNTMPSNRSYRNGPAASNRGNSYQVQDKLRQDVQGLDATNKFFNAQVGQSGRKHISPNMNQFQAYGSTGNSFSQPNRLNAFMAGMGTLNNGDLALTSLAQPTKHQHIYNFLKTAFQNLDKDQRSLEHAALAGQNLGNIHSISERFHISENLNQLQTYGGLQNFLKSHQGGLGPQGPTWSLPITERLTDLAAPMFGDSNYLHFQQQRFMNTDGPAGGPGGAWGRQMEQAQDSGRNGESAKYFGNQRMSTGKNTVQSPHDRSGNPQLTHVDSYYGNYDMPKNLQNSMLQGSKLQVPSQFRGQKTPDGLGPLACADLVSVLLDADQLAQAHMNPNEIMKEAIKQGNKNISLTTMGLKRKAKPQTQEPEKVNKDGQSPAPQHDAPLTGNPHGVNQGLANNLANLDLSTNNPLGLLILQKTSKMADIVIYHIEKNVTIDAPINKSLKQSNELIRIANLSYYHQSKSEFSLCNKELKLLKTCGIQLPRITSDSKAYFKTREFQVLLKDRALKLLVTQLQKAQNLPVTPSNYRPPTQSSEVTTPAVASPSNAMGSTGVGFGKDQGLNSTVSPEKSEKREKTPQTRKADKSSKRGRERSPPERHKIETDKSGGATSRAQNLGDTQTQFQATYFKFFVGNGNNFPLVRSVLKYRWWFQMTEKANFDKCHLIWTSWWKRKFADDLVPYDKVLEGQEQKLRIYGRMDKNHYLANKKCLFQSLKEYYRSQGRCVFKDKVFPVTFHVQDGVDDPEFSKLAHCFEEFPNSVWIVKPGENSNRGVGIQVVSCLKEIEAKVREAKKQGRDRTVIVQKYIEKPLLVYKRKFDIRAFGMLTCVNDKLRGYFYEEGYLRTSSKEFNLKALGNKYVHLTNDAIQQTATDFGKFESGNKLSFSDFQKYLKVSEDLKDQYKGDNGRVNFYKQILPQLRHLVAESFRAVAYKKVDPERRNYSFEIFGFDFMIDEDFVAYLIEANTNPCLETNSAILSRIIPVMLDASFRIAVDPILPPPELNFKRAHEALHENKYIQVFDEAIEGETLKNLYHGGRHTENGIEGMNTADDQFILSDLIGQQISQKETAAGPQGKTYNYGGYVTSTCPSRMRGASQTDQNGSKLKAQCLSRNEAKEKQIGPSHDTDDFMNTIRPNIYNQADESADDCRLQSRHPKGTGTDPTGTQFGAVASPGRRRMARRNLDTGDQTSQDHLHEEHPESARQPDKWSSDKPKMERKGVLGRAGGHSSSPGIIHGITREERGRDAAQQKERELGIELEIRLNLQRK